MSQWTYKGDPVDNLPEDCEGFVYLITNLTNEQKYIGKKLARFKVTRPPLKGRKNKRRSSKESDCRTYWGSSDHLNADVKGLGEDKFTREILYYCQSRGMLYSFILLLCHVADAYHKQLGVDTFINAGDNSVA